MSIEVPATFLDCVQRACKECSLTDVPTTVVGQVGMFGRMVSWVVSALFDIETARTDWGWMFSSFSFPTVSGQSEYTPVQAGISDFGEWDLAQMRNYNTAAGIASEIFMDKIDYNTWRDAYLYGGTRFTRTQPLQFAISPTEALCLGPVPEVGYTVEGKYYRAPQALTDDSDILTMPLEYRMMVVFKAMMYYGGYMGAPEVYDRGELEFGKLMTRLGNKRLPEIGF